MCVLLPQHSIQTPSEALSNPLTVQHWNCTQTHTHTPPVHTPLNASQTTPPPAAFQHFYWWWWREPRVTVVTTWSAGPHLAVYRRLCHACEEAAPDPSWHLAAFSVCVSELVYSRCVCGGGGAGDSGLCWIWIYFFFYDLGLMRTFGRIITGSWEMPLMFWHHLVFGFIFHHM